MESGGPLGPLPRCPHLSGTLPVAQQLPGWCWLWTLLPIREVPGVGRHQLTLPWKRDVRVEANCPFLGKRIEKGTRLLVSGAVGALDTRFFFPAQAPGSQGVGEGTRIHWGEIKGCMKRAIDWEAGDLGWAWLWSTGWCLLIGHSVLLYKMTWLKPVVSQQLSCDADWQLSWAVSIPEKIFQPYDPFVLSSFLRSMATDSEGPPTPPLTVLDRSFLILLECLPPQPCSWPLPAGLLSSFSLPGQGPLS